MPAHEIPVFDELRDNWPDRVTAWDLGKRPVPRLVSDASVLDPETAIVADYEPRDFRGLIREWPDRSAAEEIAEEQHQRDLDRAAQPPVIEVTVTTPPDGIPRLELEQAVAGAVRDFTGPQPVLPDEYEVRQPRRGKVLTATRRARKRARLAGLPPVPRESPVALPVSEDDIPTTVLPVITDGFELVEVHVP